ncbi:uncharacterized protein LOC102803532 [Saccoglossus kowalevskii]|uniref:Uncharacterized protein LOC102803532 n=1 Tax=Saccoglossus kowalevskii TaxID=10224 RepID=A0ABM0M7N2_SACKO|nr:PREDICTED: uncharacterized protein LOC102803532 [Saccoglossus kowalevskii]
MPSKFRSMNLPRDDRPVQDPPASFFGRMKKRFTKKPNSKNHDGSNGFSDSLTHGNIRLAVSGEAKCQRNRRNGVNGKISGKQTARNYCDIDLASEISTQHTQEEQNMFEKQGARPKCNGASQHLTSINDTKTVSIENGLSNGSDIGNHDNNGTSPCGNSEEQNSTSDDVFQDSAVKTLSTSSEPVHMSLNQENETEQRWEKKEVKTLKESESIPKNSEIVDLVTHSESLTTGEQSNTKDGQAEQLEDQCSTTEPFPPTSESRAETKLANPQGRDSSDKADELDNSVNISPETELEVFPPKPRMPPRPMSLNLDVQVPPPIPVRSPLARSLSMNQAKEVPKPPVDSTILENGHRSHELFPFDDAGLKALKSKTLGHQPTRKTQTHKPSKFSKFNILRGKSNKNRHTIHVMANRQLPDIPDEEPLNRPDADSPLNRNTESDVPSSPTSPTNEAGKFTSTLRHLSECGWYWGPMSWDDAEAKLADTPDGSFLVRDSSNERYLLSLSFRSNGRTHHTRIEHTKGTFGFWSQPQSHGCSSIVEFMEKAMAHSKNSKFLYFLRPRFTGAPPVPVQLTYPISRFKRVQTLQHICRFIIRRYVRLDHIETLPLPSKVKEYLLEGQYYTQDDVRPPDEDEDSDEKN